MSDPLKYLQDQHRRAEERVNACLTLNCGDPAKHQAVAETISLIIERLTPRTCDGCRHWDGADDVLIYGSCMNHKLADQESRADVAESAEFGIDGYLLTGPRFGCVHWEAKPVE